MRAAGQPALQSVTARTGGKSFAAHDEPGLVAAVTEIDRLECRPVESFQYRRYAEGYPWFALAAPGVLRGLRSGWNAPRGGECRKLPGRASRRQPDVFGLLNRDPKYVGLTARRSPYFLFCFSIRANNFANSGANAGSVRRTSMSVESLSRRRIFESRGHGFAQEFECLLAIGER